MRKRSRASFDKKLLTLVYRTDAGETVTYTVRVRQSEQVESTGSISFYVNLANPECCIEGTDLEDIRERVEKRLDDMDRVTWEKRLLITFQPAISAADEYDEITKVAPSWFHGSWLRIVSYEAGTTASGKHVWREWTSKQTQPAWLIHDGRPAVSLKSSRSYEVRRGEVSTLQMISLPDTPQVRKALASLVEKLTNQSARLGQLLTGPAAFINLATLNPKL